MRDNPLEPHLGVYSEVKVSEGGPFAAGNLTYTEVVPELRGYLPVPSTGIVLAAARALRRDLRRRPGERAVLRRWLELAARLLRAPARADGRAA